MNLYESQESLGSTGQDLELQRVIIRSYNRRKQQNRHHQMPVVDKIDEACRPTETAITRTDETMRISGTDDVLVKDLFEVSCPLQESHSST